MFGTKKVSSALPTFLDCSAETDQLSCCTKSSLNTRSTTSPFLINKRRHRPLTTSPFWKGKGVSRLQVTDLKCSVTLSRPTRLFYCTSQLTTYKIPPAQKVCVRVCYSHRRNQVIRRSTPVCFVNSNARIGGRRGTACAVVRLCVGYVDLLLASIKFVCLDSFV